MEIGANRLLNNNDVTFNLLLIPFRLKIGNDSHYEARHSERGLEWNIRLHLSELLLIDLVIIILKV